MTQFLQEFFWTPKEVVGWVARMCSAFDLWLVMSPAGEGARVIDTNDLRPEMFEGVVEDSVQLFLGGGRDLPAPAWRDIRGNRQLDFRRSYAVQLVPSVVAPDHRSLLQGRLAILRPDQYEESRRARLLVELFQALRLDMKRSSDARYRVVQSLPDGRRKIWRRMLVGGAVATSGITQLKQFAKGEVTFCIDVAAARMKGD